MSYAQRKELSGNRTRVDHLDGDRRGRADVRDRYGPCIQRDQEERFRISRRSTSRSSRRHREQPPPPPKDMPKVPPPPMTPPPLVRIERAAAADSTVTSRRPPPVVPPVIRRRRAPRRRRRRASRSAKSLTGALQGCFRPTIIRRARSTTTEQGRVQVIADDRAERPRHGCSLSREVRRRRSRAATCRILTARARNSAPLRMQRQPDDETRLHADDHVAHRG